MELSFQHPRSGEWAHDRRDPLREARLSFFEPAWEAAAPQPQQVLRMLEIGFGRGLNTAMALRMLHQLGHRGGAQAWGCEPNPEVVQPWPQVPAELADFAPWWGYTPQDLQRDGDGVGKWLWSNPAEAQQEVPIRLHALTAAELLQSLPQGSIDWFFLDLFSPAKHEEDWQQGLWTGLAKAAAPGAVLTSYTCARRVRDGLEMVGWQCQVLRRPNYRDTLRARWLPPDGPSA